MEDYVFDGWWGHAVGEAPADGDEDVLWLADTKVYVALGREAGDGRATAENIYAVWLKLPDGRKIGLSKAAGLSSTTFHPRNETWKP